MLVDEHHCPLHLLALGIRREIGLVSENILHLLLHRHIERRIDLHAALVDQILGSLSGHSLLLLQDTLRLADHLVGEVGELVGAGGALMILQLGLLGLLGLILGYFAVLDHLVEHGLLSALRQVGTGKGVVVVGALHNPRQQGALGQGQVLGVFVEVKLRCRLDAVGAVAEIDPVQVKFKDLLLGVVVLNLQSEDRLLDLAPQRLLVAEVGAPDQLLGDGAASLGCGTPAQIYPQCPGDSHRVYPHMLIEAIVFCCHKGIGQVGRQFGERHRRAVLIRIDQRCLLIVAIVDDR